MTTTGRLQLVAPSTASAGRDWAGTECSPRLLGRGEQNRAQSHGPRQDGPQAPAAGRRLRRAGRPGRGRCPQKQLPNVRGNPPEPAGRTARALRPRPRHPLAWTRMTPTRKCANGRGPLAALSQCARGEEVRAKENKPGQKARRCGGPERAPSWMNRLRSLLIRWTKQPANSPGSAPVQWRLDRSPCGWLIRIGSK